MFGRILQDVQKVIIGNQVMSGVQSVSVDESFSVEDVDILGVGFLQSAIPSRPKVRIDIDTLIITDDIILPMISGQDSIHPKFKVGDNYIDFSDKCYISSAEISARVGELVSFNYSIDCYGDATSGIYNSGIESGSAGMPIRIADAGSIDISTDSFNTHRIQGFTYSVNFIKSPIYAIGCPYPTGMYFQYPIEESLSLTVELDSLVWPDLKGTICPKDYRENISILINEHCAGTPILAIDFSGGKLESYSVRGQIGDAMTVDVSYIRRINNPLQTSLSSCTAYTYIEGYEPPRAVYVGDGPTCNKGVSQITGYN